MNALKVMVSCGVFLVGVGCGVAGQNEVTATRAVERGAEEPVRADAGGNGKKTLPVTADGTGTLCKTDADCPKEGATKCLNPKGKGGFCTNEGCAAGSCQGSYVCCHSCSSMAAPKLPFKGSACFPKKVTEKLTSFPASCTCD